MSLPCFSVEFGIKVSPKGTILDHGIIRKHKGFLCADGFIKSFIVGLHSGIEALCL